VYLLIPYLYIGIIPVKAMLFGSMIFFIFIKSKVQFNKHHLVFGVFFAFILFIPLIKQIFYYTGFYNLENVTLGIILLITIPAVTRNNKNIEIIISVMIISAATNSVICLWEVFDPEKIYHIRELLLEKSRLARGDEIDLYRFRFSGLHAFPIPYSYVLAVTTPLCVYKLFSNTNTLNRVFYSVGFILLIIGLVIGATKSSILGAVFGSMIIIKKMKRIDLFKLILLSMVVLGIFYIYYNTWETNLLHLIQENPRENVRILVWKKLIPAIFLNPLLGMHSDYSTFVSRNLGHSLINISPHNVFINISLRYGIVTTLVFIIILIKVYRDYSEVNRFSRNNSLNTGIAVSIMAYIFNSLFHNASIITSIDFWIIAGLFYANRQQIINMRRFSHERTYLPAAF